MQADEISAFIARLTNVDIRAMGDGELTEGCLAVTTLLDVVQAHAAELLAEFQQRETWAVDGATSGAAWLAARCPARRAELASLANVGAALRQLPAVTAAARSGEIGFDHVRRIKDCARKGPGLSAEDEAFLLEQARIFDPDMFRVLARQWRAVAEDTADEDAPVEEGPARQEFLHLSQTLDGWWRLDGELSPDNGAIVAAYLDEHVDRAMRAQRGGDPALERLPASALRAEALVDLVAQHQRREPSDNSVADRYRVAIVIRPDQYPMEACDADRYRVVLNAEGEVLDIGRDTRDWTPPIRRAVIARDGGCVFPGCDRPPSWCEIHHCWEWENGGPTCQDNGALMCRRHHTFIHAKKWRVVIPKPRGKPIVLQPDGTPFTIKPWQLAS